MTVRLRDDLDTLPAYIAGKTVENALKLSSNEVPHPPLPAAQAAAIAAVAQANRYPDIAAMTLRTELAQHFGTTAASIAVGCGSSALCLQLIQATCGEGDEVLFPWRSFEAYPILAQVAGATPVAVPLDANGVVDLTAMTAALTERTRLIFVCNPNNPTGTVVTEQPLRDFLDTVPADVLVVMDEAYIEYVRSTEVITAPELMADYPNVCCLRTFSKAYGLAGMRIGYLYADADVVTAVNKMQIPFAVTAPTEAAAVASIQAADELLARTDEVVNNRTRITAALREQGLPAVESEANFVWIPAADNAVALAEAFGTQGVIVRCFAGDGVRITATDAAETERLLAAIAQLPREISA